LIALRRQVFERLRLKNNDIFVFSNASDILKSIILCCVHVTSNEIKQVFGELTKVKPCRKCKASNGLSEAEYQIVPTL